MARLSDSEISKIVEQNPEWEVVSEDGISKLVQKFAFRNFLEALEFANRVGALAEDSDHHPKLVVEWGSLEVWWWSHDEGGMIPADAELAAEVDSMFAES